MKKWIPIYGIKYTEADVKFIWFFYQLFCSVLPIWILGFILSLNIKQPVQEYEEVRITIKIIK
jgi:hypothetical protein